MFNRCVSFRKGSGLLGLGIRSSQHPSNSAYLLWCCIKLCFLSYFLSWITLLSCHTWLSSNSSLVQNFVGSQQLWLAWVAHCRGGISYSHETQICLMFRMKQSLQEMNSSLFCLRSKHWSWIPTFTELDRVKCFSELEFLLILKKSET